MYKEKILIFGDSYSTYRGYVPTGYAVYYPNAAIADVDDVSKTWWKLLETETESEILLNNSWSGSTVCNTGYQGDCSKTSSFLHRLDVLIQAGFFRENQLDRVLVFGGTNDSWTGNACGEAKFEDWTEEELFFILPGIACFLARLQTAVEKEKIHFVINTELRQEVKEGILSICDHYGIGYTPLTDIDKINGHPTAAGMQAIKDQVLADLG